MENTAMMMAKTTSGPKRSVSTKRHHPEFFKEIKEEPNEYDDTKSPMQNSKRNSPHSSIML